MRIFFIIIVCSVLGSFKAHAQTKEDIRLVSGLIKAPDYRVRYHVRKEKNLLKECAGAMFVFYKDFVSSQDGNHCSFTPSCSEFTIQSIRRKGFFTGVFAGFDRLTRCNGLSPEEYPTDKRTGLLYDPVK